MANGNYHKTQRKRLAVDDKKEPRDVGSNADKLQ